MSNKRPAGGGAESLGKSLRRGFFSPLLVCTVDDASAPVQRQRGHCPCQNVTLPRAMQVTQTKGSATGRMRGTATPPDSSQEEGGFQ